LAASNFILYYGNAHNKMRMSTGDKENTVSKRVLLIGLLVVGVALLSGCELLDAITGGGTTPPGGGTTGPGAVTSVSISYNLAATISERLMPTYPVTTKEGSVVMDFFRPYGGSYNANTRTFTNNWDNQVGDFSNTDLVVRLNAAEDAIEYFYARQTQSNVWFAWTYVNEIRGYNIPISTHTDPNFPGSRYFIVTGTNAHLSIDRMIYKGWARESEGYSATNPIEWAYLDNDIIPSINDIIPASTNAITIRLDY
jgi:hypothetical protein